MSVFRQNYTGPKELVIVDDASYDNSVSIIREAIRRYGEGWDCTLLVNEKNLGVAGTIDRGWKAARYEWIVEVDGDDIQHPERCANTARLIEKYPGAGMISLSYTCIDSEGREFDRGWMVDSECGSDFCADSPQIRADIYNQFGRQFPVSWGAFGCSMSIKKSIVELWGALWSEGKERFAQDLPWELRAILSSNIVWSNELACGYRMHSSNILNRAKRYETLADWCQNESDCCRYARKEQFAAEQMIRDITRAISSPQLTDWSSEQLERTLQKLERYRLVARLRHEWWGYNVLKRIVYALKYSRRVPHDYSRWFVNRILPLKWAMWLKMRMK